MNINQEGLDLIKHFEGFRAKAYYCPAGVLTIGYGTTGNRVKSGMTIDEKTAAQWLLEDVKKFTDGVKLLVKVKLGSNQFSALVSFAYNVGLGAFEKSTLLRKLNSSDYREAAAEFNRWVKGGGKTLPGLVRRRNAEKALFFKPDPIAVKKVNNTELNLNVEPKLTSARISQQTSGKNIFSSMNATLYPSESVQSDRLRIVYPTFLKLKTCSHVKLRENQEKVAIPVGCEFPFLACKEEKGHFKVTFGDRGSDIKFAGRNTWFLWHEHVKFVRESPAKTVVVP